MSYTMEDFERDLNRKFFLQLTPEEQQKVLPSLPPEVRQKVLQSVPAEERLAGLSAEQIRQYLDQLTAGRSPKPRKPRRKR